MAKKWNFGNGRLICILRKTVKGAWVASSRIQILDQLPSEKQELQKTEYGLQNKVHPSKTSFHCRTSGKEDP